MTLWVCVSKFWAPTEIATSMVESLETNLTNELRWHPPLRTTSLYLQSADEWTLCVKKSAGFKAKGELRENQGLKGETRRLKNKTNGELSLATGRRVEKDVYLPRKAQLGCSNQRLPVFGAGGVCGLNGNQQKKQTTNLRTNGESMVPKKQTQDPANPRQRPPRSPGLRSASFALAGFDRTGGRSREDLPCSKFRPLPWVEIFRGSRFSRGNTVDGCEIHFAPLGSRG